MKIRSKNKRPNLFGITRLKNPLGWWIRLGYRQKEDGKRGPLFQECIWDSEFDGCGKLSLSKALSTRDTEIHNYPPAEIDPRIKNPVSRLSIGSCRNRTGGKYYCWNVSLLKNAKTFSFWASGEIGSAFDLAVEYAVNNGCTIKEPDMDKAFEIYLSRPDSKEFRNFINNKAIL